MSAREILIFASLSKLGPHYPIARREIDGPVTELYSVYDLADSKTFSADYLRETIQETGELISRGWLGHVEGSLVLDYLFAELASRV